MRVNRRLTLPLATVKAAHRRVCVTPQAKAAYNALWKRIHSNPRTAKQAFIDNQDRLLVYMIDQLAGEPTQCDVGIVFTINDTGAFDSKRINGVENLTELRVKVRNMAVAK